MEVFLFLVFWGLLAWGVAALANSRGRSGIGFFLLSFILSPLLGIIVVLIMTDLVAAEAAASLRRRDEESREKFRSEEHERQLESIKAIAAAQKPQISSVPALTPVIGSIADEIRKLGQLRTDGMLTDAEFQSQKTLLLDSAKQVPLGTQLTPVSDQPKAEPSKIQRFGVCSHSKSTIPLLSTTCPSCGVPFRDGSIWSVKSI